MSPETKQIIDVVAYSIVFGCLLFGIGIFIGYGLRHNARD